MAYEFDGSLSMQDGRVYHEGELLEPGEAPDPLDLLLHEDPFLFISRVVDLVPGESAVTEWNPTGEEDFFKGHFPGNPVLPGVLQVESMAQSSGIAALSGALLSETKRLPMLAGIDKARFRGRVGPGDNLRVEASITKLSARSGKAATKATLNGETASEAELLFILGDQE